jgi:hypothetical protein
LGEDEDVFDTDLGEIDDVFDIDLGEIDRHFLEDCPPLIAKAPSRLQYVTIYEGKFRSWKRLSGEWVVCEMSECHQV